jgi:exopolyphosphatase/guanosine-5'-triphosphate,3'-diphosphate pyrophosphatase
VIFSTIDIGTNTVLMVTVEVDSSGTIHVLGDEHGIARLGKGVDASRRITREAAGRVESFLMRYRTIADELGATRIAAFGTSALRDAANRSELIAEIAARTGITIEILSGDDEARLTYRGALFGLPVDERPVAVLDIGGGSTEIATGTGPHFADGISLDIGAVRITERFLTELPAGTGNIAQARELARAALAGAIPLPSDVTAVGVAGTVTTLGAIEAGMERFDAERLNGTQLSTGAVTASVERLSRLTVEETAAIPQVTAGRADILLGGAIILDEFLRRYGLESITVSTRGVRYGVMLREVENAGAAGA